MWKIVLGLFLAAHGLIHMGFLSPVPADPNYPFSLNKSWLVSNFGLGQESVRLLGILLSIITVVGFALTGLAAVGIIVPAAWGLPLTILASLASLLLLVLFWHTWLILGIAIDVVLLIALLWLRWTPFSEVGI